MPFNIIFDASKQGLRAVLRDWEEHAIRAFWENPALEMSSRDIWLSVHRRLESGSISRASIINFLEEMTSAGVLRRREITGKGGHQGIYAQAMNESEFKKIVATAMIECLIQNFPNETKEAIKTLI